MAREVGAGDVRNLPPPLLVYHDCCCPLRLLCSSGWPLGRSHAAKRRRVETRRGDGDTAAGPGQRELGAYLLNCLDACTVERRPARARPWCSALRRQPDSWRAELAAAAAAAAAFPGRSSRSAIPRSGDSGSMVSSASWCLMDGVLPVVVGRRPVRCSQHEHRHMVQVQVVRMPSLWLFVAHSTLEPKGTSRSGQ